MTGGQVALIVVSCWFLILTVIVALLTVGTRRRLREDITEYVVHVDEVDR